VIRADLDPGPAMTKSWSKTSSSALLSRGPIAVGIAFLAALVLGYIIVFWKIHPAWPADSFTYYLAGQRLDTGGKVYDVRPSDFWPAGGPTLYGPPLVAVIWRPLAAIPGQWGILLWIVGVDFLVLWAVALVLLELPLLGGIAVLVLGLSIERLMGVGNVDGLVLVGMIGAWRFRDRPGVVGTILGFLVSLKLTPAFLVVWLVSTRRWRAVGYAILAGIVLMAITSWLSNEPGIAIRYLAVMRDGLMSGFPWARFAVVGGVICVFLVGRRWPSLAFSLAVALVPLASPVTALHTFALLLAAFAPLIEFRHRRSSTNISPSPIEGSSDGGTIGGLRARTTARIVQK
jgi:hypothetical protein